jgi:hypothetical protein
LLALLERAARHDLEQHALFTRRVIENFGADRVGLAEIAEERQAFVYAGPSHGETRSTIARNKSALAQPPGVSVRKRRPHRHPPTYCAIECHHT